MESQWFIAFISPQCLRNKICSSLFTSIIRCLESYRRQQWVWISILTMLIKRFPWNELKKLQWFYFLPDEGKRKVKILLAVFLVCQICPSTSGAAATPPWWPSMGRIAPASHGSKRKSRRRGRTRPAGPPPPASWKFATPLAPTASRGR